MEIVVRGRHMEVSDRFREHVAQKLSKIERYDGKCHRVDVELSQESNPRLADQAVRIEITCHGKGPVIRAEAAADEKHAALDIAYGRLVERLRRAADRRHDHHRSQGRALAERMHAAAVSTVPASTDASDSSDDRRRRGSAHRAGEDAPRTGDDPRPGPLRDGAGRARLLPVPRRSVRTRPAWSTDARGTTTASCTSRWARRKPRASLQGRPPRSHFGMLGGLGPSEVPWR